MVTSVINNGESLGIVRGKLNDNFAALEQGIADEALVRESEITEQASILENLGLRPVLMAANPDEFQVYTVKVNSIGDGMYAIDDIVTTDEGIQLKIASIPIQVGDALEVVNPAAIYDTDPAATAAATTGGSGTGLLVDIVSVYAEGNTVTQGTLRHVATTDPLVQRTMVARMIAAAMTSVFKPRGGVTYVGLHSNIEAYTATTAGNTALATDTQEMGYFDGAAWLWTAIDNLTDGNVWLFSFIVQANNTALKQSGNATWLDGTFFVQETDVSMPDGTTLEIGEDGLLRVRSGGIGLAQLAAAVTNTLHTHENKALLDELSQAIASSTNGLQLVNAAFATTVANAKAHNVFAGTSQLNAGSSLPAGVMYIRYAT